MIDQRARRQGHVVLERHENVPSDKVEPLLSECFELEAASWKARAGTAVLQYPQVWALFLQQAQLLARAGELAIATLRHDKELIAFEYGWQSRGVRSVLKIGFKESRSDLSPGHLLRLRLLEELFAERDAGWVDFVGPTTRATKVWATHCYRVGRILLAGGIVGRAALKAWTWKQFPGVEHSEDRVPLGCPAPALEDRAMLAPVQAT
jgi:CelD/BcsL family acetyltransferase involved in cellulose biosynthesis